MDSERKMICIRCPRGCELITSLDGHGSITSIQGNHCRMGEEYAQTELKDPKRIVTTTVRVENGSKNVVPVWSEIPAPKDRILDIVNELNTIRVQAPVVAGQLIYKNILGLNMDIIASGNVGLKADGNDHE